MSPRLIAKMMVDAVTPAVIVPYSRDNVVSPPPAIWSSPLNIPKR